MTLIVATRTDTGVWMGSERIEGGNGLWFTEMSGSKIARLTGDHEILVGTSASGRVAQTIETMTLPAIADDRLEAWVTAWCDAVRDRLDALGLIVPNDTDPPVAAGGSLIVLAVDGRVFFIDSDLAWSEPAKGWVAIGGAADVFAGAYEVLREHHDPVVAARYAWPFCQRHYRIGDLVDELTLDAA